MRCHEVDEVSWSDSVRACGWFCHTFEHSDYEHARAALWHKVPSIDLQQVAPVTQIVEALDSRSKIGATVRRGKSRYILQKDRLWTPGTHFLKDTSELPEHPRA